MARTIRTCSLAIAAVLAALAPVEGAGAAFVRSSASTFVAARAAANAGDARRAALLYASLAAADPGNRVIASRALGQAILGGDMALALRLATAAAPTDRAPDARLLLAAEALKSGAPTDAMIAAWPPEMAFIKPFVRAWGLSGRRDWRGAVAELDKVGPDNMLAPVVAEHKVLILLAAGRVREAQPLIPQALAKAGGRADRLRIVFAHGLAREGERQAGMALLQGRDATLSRAAAILGADRRPDHLVAAPAQGFSELLAALAIMLGQAESRSLPLALVQIARYADPANPEVAVLLGLILGQSERGDDALAVLRSVPSASPFASEAADAEIRILLRASRREEVLARAQAFVADGGASAEDWSRLGDVFDAMERHGDAAEAYGKALRLVEAGGPGPEPWSLHLLRGAALEQAERWPEAEKALEAAHALAPDNPVVLNYLGYARLERGEQLDEAEALIARASSLAPDDASITDSLGWAQFKRGKLQDAIATLQRAAAADPAQAEIHEHLGDALYVAGRKYEARFAWNAALVTAEDEVKQRVEAKIAGGLTPKTAAP